MKAPMPAPMYIIAGFFFVKSVNALVGSTASFSGLTGSLGASSSACPSSFARSSSCSSFVSRVCPGAGGGVISQFASIITFFMFTLSASILIRWEQSTLVMVQGGLPKSGLNAFGSPTQRASTQWAGPRSVSLLLMQAQKASGCSGSLLAVMPLHSAPFGRGCHYGPGSFRTPLWPFRDRQTEIWRQRRHLATLGCTQTSNFATFRRAYRCRRRTIPPLAGVARCVRPGVLWIIGIFDPARIIVLVRTHQSAPRYLLRNRKVVGAISCVGQNLIRPSEKHHAVFPMCRRFDDGSGTKLIKRTTMVVGFLQASSVPLWRFGAPRVA